MNTTSLSDKVYEGIRDRINSCTYSPYEFLNEQRIAEDFGVSKGTAADALHRLCKEEHLKSFPRKGYMINIIPPEEYNMVCELRVALESAVIDKLCTMDCASILSEMAGKIERNELPEGLTSQNRWFHLSLANATGNKYFAKHLCELFDVQSRNEVFFRRVPVSMDQQYHLGIIKGILEKDATSAKSMLIADLHQGDSVN